MVRQAPLRSAKIVRLRDHSAASRGIGKARPEVGAPKLSPRPSNPANGSDPVETRDRESLRSVAREIGASLVSVTKEWVGEFGFERHLVSYASEGAVTPAARRIVEDLTKPAARKDVDPNLRAVALAMGRRPDDDVAPDTWLDLAWKTVSDFPEDVILQGLETAVRQEGCRPSPSLIRGECRRLNERRAALQKWARATHAGASQPGRLR